MPAPALRLYSTVGCEIHRVHPVRAGQARQPDIQPPHLRVIANTLLRHSLRRRCGSRRIRRVQHGRRPVVGRHAMIISRVFRGRTMVAGRGIVRAARQGYRSKYNQKDAIHRLSKGNITAQARRESTCKVFLRQWPPSAITTPRAHAYGICRFLPSDLLCTHGCNRRRRLPWTLNRSRVLSGSRWACWS